MSTGSETMQVATVHHEAPPRWTLEVRDRETVRRVPISERPLVLGSGRSAAVLLNDRTVSGEHCEVTVSEGRVGVRDLGSTNGTFVGGARIEHAWGSVGTTITIGQSTLVCLPHDESDAELPDEHDPLPGIAGSSMAMREVAAQVRRLATTTAPVLVVGESGTGKELVAQALHAEGPRRNAPLVALNVAALPRELVESELFGHERGAFTGAVNRREGAFVEADGGTLFLDEIGDLPLEAQPKLLRALDGYEVRRVGGTGRKPNTRIVTATHVNLENAVDTGRFRRDLFHRLEVFVVELPPLRARTGDIMPIARVLLRKLENEVGPRDLTPAGLALLTAQEWPGNVRELNGVLQRAALATRSRWLDAAVLEKALRKRMRRAQSLTPESAAALLRRHEGNASAAAREAGIARTSFRKLLDR